MAKKHMATLVGGPCDGHVVEIIGTCFTKALHGGGGFFYAVYQWDEEVETGNFIGRFVGYRRNGRPVNQFGVRIRSKKK